MSKTSKQLAKAKSILLLRYLNPRKWSSAYEAFNPGQ